MLLFPRLINIENDWLCRMSYHLSNRILIFYKFGLIYKFYKNFYNYNYNFLNYHLLFKVIYKSLNKQFIKQKFYQQR